MGPEEMQPKLQTAASFTVGQRLLITKMAAQPVTSACENQGELNRQMFFI